MFDILVLIKDGLFYIRYSSCSLNENYNPSQNTDGLFAYLSIFTY